MQPNVHEYGTQKGAGSTLLSAAGPKSYTVGLPGGDDVEPVSAVESYAP